MVYLSVLLVVAILSGWWLDRRRRFVKTKAVGEPAVFSATKAPTVRHSTLATSEIMWLESRWAERRAKRVAGHDGAPHWWWDEATERQLERLRQLDVSVPVGVNKGEASDLIGLYVTPEDDEFEVLRYFKVSTKGLNQTRVRYLREEILADPEKKTRWETRPPTPQRRRFFEFFGIPLPPGITEVEAQELEEEKYSKLYEVNDPRIEDYDSYLAILDSFSDRDTCETYHVKKPAAALLKRAIAELVVGGHTYRQLKDNPNLVASKLCELKPDLTRAD
jgi:hypothetical protein